MRITAKLAYSQLKTNRSRTMWTLIGIALSTALITAVCSFVASANSMLVNVLGVGYGDYGQSYMALLLVPAIFFGVSVVNHYLDELNSLVHIMMTEITWVVNFVVSWQALLVAASISFLSVLFSAWFPANKAAKVTAIDGIRGKGEVKLAAKQLQTSPLVQKLFGFEGTLAVKT